jgi:hypothetical protein
MRLWAKLARGIDAVLNMAFARLSTLLGGAGRTALATLGWACIVVGVFMADRATGAVVALSAAATLSATYVLAKRNRPILRLHSLVLALGGRRHT